jgi:nitrate/nitrite transport system ATP-binding protein
VRETQQTVFMITHDVDEAILLADRILLMSQRQRDRRRLRARRHRRSRGNPLPRERTRAGLHHLPGYYDAAQPHRRLPGHASQGADRTH